MDRISKELFYYYQSEKIYLTERTDEDILLNAFMSNGTSGIDNDYGLSYPRGSSIPYSGKRMLTVTVQDNW
jgi:hypothetical protein